MTSRNGRSLLEFLAQGALDLTLEYFDQTIRINQRDDGLYHAYNVLEISPDRVAVERLQAAPFAGIIVTDSIPLAPEKTLPTITVLSVASLLGQAIKRIHQHQSISAMFDLATHD